MMAGHARLEVQCSWLLSDPEMLIDSKVCQDKSTVPTTVSVAEVLWEGTARTVRDATDAWKDEERGAARALATDLLLQAAVDLVQVTQQLVARTWDELFFERIRDVESTGQRLEKWTETARHLAE